jgi:hypothetical protein
MLIKLLIKTKKYVANFLLAQLIITLISLPILIHWGITISKFGIVGNLIFSPILSIFLILSSLIFFTELLTLPKKALDQLTCWWDNILNLGQKSWLIGFATQNTIFLLTIPFLAFLIIFHKKVNTITKRIIALSVLLFASIALLCVQDFLSIKENIELQNGKSSLKIIPQNNNLIINDYGFFSKKRNLQNFLEYEFRPYLLKKFGTLKIEKLSLLKPSKSNYKIIEEFKKIFDVQKTFEK